MSEEGPVDILRHVSSELDQMENVLGDEHPDHADAYLERIGRVVRMLTSLERSAPGSSFDGYHLGHFRAKALAIQGILLHSADRRSEALASLKDALSVRPDFALAHAGMATLYLQDRDLEAARKHIRRASEIEPDDPRYKQASEALQCYTLDDIDEIRAHQCHLPGDDPEAAEKMALSERLMNSGKIREAIDVLKSMVESARFDEDRMFAAGLICSVYGFRVLDGQMPEPGTLEFDDVRKYLRIALEAYEKSSGLMKREFAAANNVDVMKRMLEALDQEASD